MINNLDELKQLIKENDEFKFKIKVIPNSKDNSFDFLEDFIKIKIKQKPIEGKANKAIVEYLSDLLSCPKSKIKIVNGEKSCLKTILILK